jgi:NAD(P)-dependent dehydrogenase (short-subunit alcohol dehydrogenase family)
MKNFAGKLAVVTGGGTGMGRELARQLVEQDCHVALCDVSLEEMETTRKSCADLASEGIRISTHRCDVSNESDVLAFRDAVAREHETDCINLLFNNAGISGGGSFVTDDRAEWEKTFGVCWNGVYFCTRAFMPMLLASDEGHLVNTSSVNGFWASLGSQTAHTAYSTAKFAVKGFSEALLTDLRLNAPHVKVSLVMPGHIGTSIALNSFKLHGGGTEQDGSFDMGRIRERMAKRGILVDQVSDEQLRAGIEQQLLAFRDKAPVTAAEAARVILDGVREERWRILIGDDAHILDRLVRESPEGAYDAPFARRLLSEGVFSNMPMASVGEADDTEH